MRSKRTLRVEISLKTMLYAVLTLGAAWVTVQLWPVLLVLVAALFLVGTVTPIVEWLQRHRIKRGWGIALVFAGIVLLSGLATVITGPALVEQVKTLVQQEPQFRSNIAGMLEHSSWGKDFAKSLRNVHYDALARVAAPTALAFSTGAVEILAYLVSAFFLAVYIMIDRDRLRGGMFMLVPRAHHLRFARILVRLETIVGGYIRGQVLTSTLMAVFVVIVLSICGLPNAIALGMFAGIADVLPYIGVFLSVGPAVLVALSKGATTAIIVLVSLLAYEEFESRVLVPRIYGRVLRLPSTIVLVSLLVGGKLMGILGALLALPVAASLRMLTQELPIEFPGVSTGSNEHVPLDAAEQAEYLERAAGASPADAASIAIDLQTRRSRA